MYFEDNVGVIVNPKREGKGSTADQKPLSVETADGNSNGIASGRAMKRNNGVPVSGYQDPRFAFDGLRPPLPWLDGLVFSYPRPMTSTSITSSISNANNVTALRNLQPYSHFMGLQHPIPMSDMGTAHGFMNRMYPNKLYGHLNIFVVLDH
ncbi:unnamed protein product, partial [Vitis vinifera]